MGENRDAGQERAHKGGFWGRVLLIAGIAAAPLAAGTACDNSAPPVVEDADAENGHAEDADSEAPDEGGVEDDASMEDAPVPDAEDVSPSEDAPVPDADAEEDVGEAGDDGGAPECTAVGTHTEEIREDGPGKLCDEFGAEGSAQQNVATWEVIEWAGPDCTEPETRSIYSYEIIVDPPIPEIGIDCAGSDMVAMPWGEEVVVSVSAGSLVTAARVDDAVLEMRRMHDWGTGEYKSMLSTIVALDTVSVSTYDSGGAPLSPVRVSTMGYADLPAVDGMGPRGYLVESIDDFYENAHITYIETPVIERLDGSVVTFEGRDYVLHINMEGGSWHGIGLSR